MKPKRDRRKFCKFKYDDLYDYYDTQCGNAYCFEDTKIPSDTHKFCPGCGKQIKVIGKKP